MKIKPVAGFEGLYTIAEDGCVRRVDRTPHRPIVASIGKVGYPVVSLWKDNRGTTRYVHRMLLEAFVGACPKGHEALHRNGNRLDFRLSNLRWGTRAENMADAVLHGTATVGSRNKNAKLRACDIGFIRDMKLMGFTSREIAPHFNVTPNTIHRLFRGETYRQEF